MQSQVASSITIIDDNEYLMEFLEARFKAERWRTYRFTGSEAAKRHLLRNRCDCLLLDIDLGPENGLDVLRGLRSERRTRDLKVMVLSAHRRAVAVADAAKLNAVDYVVKPFDLDDLVRRIRRQLSREATAVTV